MEIWKANLKWENSNNAIHKERLFITKLINISKLFNEAIAREIFKRIWIWENTTIHRYMNRLKAAEV
jgi:hypothetical protein